jgi:hypothetical protein
LAGCGGGNPSLNEYVDTLNAMNDEFSPRGEAIWSTYLGKPARTIDDLRALLDADLALRLDVEDALGELETPDQIAETHEQWIAWHSRLLAADRGQVERAASVDSLDEFLGSAEFAEWGNTLKEGSVLCAEFESSLNSTEAQELFADTAWMPSDLTKVVHAVIGCESFPDDLDDLSAIYGG